MSGILLTPYHDWAKEKLSEIQEQAPFAMGGMTMQ